MDVITKRQLLNYNAETGDFTWLVARGGRKAGSLAGTYIHLRKPNGVMVYRTIRIDKRHNLAHRLAWEFTYGEIPSGMQIDHINRNPSDNRIQNLRLVTPSQNSINTKRRNASGHTGVYKHKQSGGWCAELTFNRRSVLRKHFATKKEAIKARREAENSIRHLF